MQNTDCRKAGIVDHSQPVSSTVETLKTESDEHLIALFREGQPKAFDALISRYERKIYNLAWRLARNHDDAQDIASEALLRICLNLRNVKHAVTLPAWVNRIVVHVFVNSRRYAQRRAATSLEALQEKAGDAVLLEERSTAQSPQELAEASERKAILKRAIATLPDSQRPLVTLFHYDGLSYEEIADTLKIPTGTVKSRLSRARTALRNALNPYRAVLVN